MLRSEAIGRHVLSTGSAMTVGTVAGFIVDPATARIVAIRLKKTPGSGDTLHWPDLTSFGTDNVTVPSVEVITQATGTAEALDSKSGEMVGKRVVTDAGAEAGVVEDFEFDPVSGTVTCLRTSQGQVNGDRLIGCGSYAVIVKHS